MNREPSGPQTNKIDNTWLLKLMVSLDPILQYKTFPAGYRFSQSVSSTSRCIFILDGVISFQRQPGDILFDLVDAPVMLGGIPIHPESKSVYTIKVLCPAKMAVISTDALYQELSNRGLWEIYAKHMLLFSSMLVESLFKRSSPSAYDAIKFQLIELINKPENIRKNILAENFIRGKTRLSRSTVMKILSGLRKGGYIVIENGILQDVKTLPLKW